MTPDTPSNVARVIDGYDAPVREGVLALRSLIFSVAADHKIAPVEEALRWGQPAYLTHKGSTLRIAPHRQACFAIYAHCQSTVITSYAQAFPGWDRLDGNRAVLFDTVEEVEPERLSHLIHHALNYHIKT